MWSEVIRLRYWNQLTLCQKKYRGNRNVAPRCCSYLITLKLSGKNEKANSGPQVFRKQLLFWNKQTPQKTIPTTDNNFTVSNRGFSAWSEVGVIHKPSISKLMRKVGRVGRTNIRLKIVEDLLYHLGYLCWILLQLLCEMVGLFQFADNSGC